MILAALSLLMQDAPTSSVISQMEQRFAACGFPQARITLDETLNAAAVTLDPQGEPSDTQLACAARWMNEAHLFPGKDSPAFAEKLRPFLLRAMAGSQEQERQRLIERDDLGPAVASLTPLRGNTPALADRLIELCGPESRKLIRTITPPGASRPQIELRPLLKRGEATAAIDKSFTCLLELATAADLDLGFTGNEAPSTAPLPSPRPSR